MKPPASGARRPSGRAARNSASSGRSRGASGASTGRRATASSPSTAPEAASCAKPAASPARGPTIGASRVRVAAGTQRREARQRRCGPGERRRESRRRQCREACGRPRDSPASRRRQAGCRFLRRARLPCALRCALPGTEPPCFEPPGPETPDPGLSGAEPSGPQPPAAGADESGSAPSPTIRGLVSGASPVARTSAGLADNLAVGNLGAAIHALDHIDNRQCRNRHGPKRPHLAPVRSAVRTVASIAFEAQIHACPMNANRAGKRRQVGNPLRARNAGNARNRKHVPLRHRARSAGPASQPANRAPLPIPVASRTVGRFCVTPAIRAPASSRWANLGSAALIGGLRTTRPRSSRLREPRQRRPAPAPVRSHTAGSRSYATSSRPDAPEPHSRSRRA